MNPIRTIEAGIGCLTAATYIWFGIGAAFFILGLSLIIYGLCRIK
jgi:hypothetical protein